MKKFLIPSLLCASIIFTFSSCKRTTVQSNSNQVKLKRVLKPERERFKDSLYTYVINKNLRLPITDSTEKYWEDAFWAIGLVLDSSKNAEEGIRESFKDFNTRSLEFQRSSLEAAYTVFPDSYFSEIFNIVKTINNPKLFAMGINYLVRNKHNKFPNSFYENLLYKTFPDWKNDPILFELAGSLKTPEENLLKKIPSLVDILSHNFGKGMTIIYSFQREDRDYPGIAIIRKPDGKFVRTADGTIFYIQQLARAKSNLPGYITNGNTPEGIFSVQGVDNSKDAFIGPTTNIQLVLPFESNPKEYFHNKDLNDTVMTMTLYSNLLPESWKNYFPIYGTFYAGKAGRTAIISHGTTTNPDFYKGKPYYPNTPTLGCLSASEIWSEKNGTRLESDQQALADAFLSSGSKYGYLVVINLDNKKQPVVLSDVIMDILKAEQRIQDNN
jgi:hypothetical protein